MSPRTSKTRWLAAMLFALALSPFLAHRAAAEACGPDDEEDRVSEDILVILRPDWEDQAVAVDHILSQFPELTLSEPLRHIHALRAWLFHATNPTETLLGDLEHATWPPDPDPSGVDLVKRAEFHWSFQTPEGGQRAFIDLTRSFTVDDFLFQNAATVIRAQPTGRRWTGNGVTVAVIDTAATLDNPVTSSFIQGSGVDAISGTGSAQVVANGLDDDGDGAVDESAEHATFVAGLVHLAAPEAGLFHVRVLDDDGHGDAWDVAEGIVDAVLAGADVVNLSLGVTNELRILQEAVDWAEHRNVVVVAAAGNRAMPCLDRPADEAGEAEHAVIAVAAVDDALQPAEFTNHAEEVTLSAPGVDVISTYGADFGSWSGTSFSTPMVAGGAAVLLQKYPGMSAADIKAALEDTAQPLADPGLTDMGAGVLDLGLLQDYVGPHRENLRLEEDGDDMVASWSPVEGAGTFDLLRGEIRNLRRAGGSIDLGPMKCIRNDYAGAPEGEHLGDFDPVPPGGGYFYVLRDDGTGGDVPGHSSFGEPRVPGATDCP